MADVAQKSYLEMTDEELLAAPVPDFTPAPTQTEADDSADMDTGAAQDTQDAEDTADTVQQAAATQDAAEDAVDTAGDAADDGDADGASAPAKEAGKAPVPTQNTAPAKTEQDTPPADGQTTQAKTVIDYKAEYERLLAPFKANGREIQVKSVDDAVALMQMGANYNKKMAALKPNLKLLKLLENSGLLSEEKIGYLIDLGNKNPDAINKLVKDAGINPLDLDTDKAGNYKPTVHAVDDREIELDTVLEEIQESPQYTRLLQVVGKEWDGESKKVVGNAPQLLKVIESHMASGIYDLISKEVANERLFGRLNGLSDIEAYRAVGDALNSRGAFNHLVQNQRKPANGEVVQPKPKKADDAKLAEKRRAAAPTKVAAPSTQQADFNPLALSDEDFAKMADPRFR